MEKEVWEGVGTDLLSGDLKLTPEVRGKDFQESYVLQPMGGTDKDILQ
jgi:hypothetical protein